MPISTNAGFAYFVGNANWGIGAAYDEREYWLHAALRHAGLPDEARLALCHWGLVDGRYEQLANENMRRHMRDRPGELAAKIGLNALEQYFPVSRLAYLNLRGYSSEGWGDLILRPAFRKALMMSLFHAALLAAAARGMARARKKGRATRTWRRRARRCRSSPG